MTKGNPEGSADTELSILGKGPPSTATPAASTLVQPAFLLCQALDDYHQGKWKLSDCGDDPALGSSDIRIGGLWAEIELKGEPAL